MSFLGSLLGRHHDQQTQVQQPQYQGDIRQGQATQFPQLQVQQAQGNPANLQQAWGGGMGSGTRIPNFTQPSRQQEYEDEYLPNEAVQPTGYITPQTSINSSFFQEADPTSQLRRLLRF